MTTTKSIQIFTLNLKNRIYKGIHDSNNINCKNNILRNGYGIMEYNDGRIYDGYWSNNKKNGLGKMTYMNYINVRTYYGEWKNNKM